MASGEAVSAARGPVAGCAHADGAARHDGEAHRDQRCSHARRMAYLPAPDCSRDSTGLMRPRQRFTTVTVMLDGYGFEWCTTLCATTPAVSS